MASSFANVSIEISENVFGSGSERRMSRGKYAREKSLEGTFDCLEADPWYKESRGQIQKVETLRPLDQKASCSLRYEVKEIGEKAA